MGEEVFFYILERALYTAAGIGIGWITSDIKETCDLWLLKVIKKNPKSRI